MGQKLEAAYVELAELKAVEREMRGQIIPGIPNDDPSVQAAVHHAKVIDALGALVSVIRSHPPTPYPASLRADFAALCFEVCFARARAGRTETEPFRFCTSLLGVSGATEQKT
jgi:hypothetical protein